MSEFCVNCEETEKKLAFYIEQFKKVAEQWPGDGEEITDGELIGDHIRSLRPRDTEGKVKE